MPDGGKQTHKGQSRSLQEGLLCMIIGLITRCSMGITARTRKLLYYRNHTREHQEDTI